MLTAMIVYIIAGLGAGIGTGLAGLSAAAVISPMLITFLDVCLNFYGYRQLYRCLSSEYGDG